MSGFTNLTPPPLAVTEWMDKTLPFSIFSFRVHVDLPNGLHPSRFPAKSFMH